jgi:hypothetical protein
MEIRDGQSIGFTPGHPFFAPGAVAFWAMSVAAPIVGVTLIWATVVGAFLFMAAQFSGTAVANGRHHFLLVAGEFPLANKSLAMGPGDIGHLKKGFPHVHG